MHEIDEPPKPLRGKISKEKISELADSLKEVGQLEPILVCQLGDRYQIISGHRRYLAAKLLGWDTIQAVILTKTTHPLEIIAAHENLHREDLSPLEEARLIHSLHHEQGYEISSIARMLSHSPSWVQTRIDLYFLPEYLKEELEAGRINISVARELAVIEDEDHRRYLVSMAAQFGATHRTAISWRQQWEATQLQAKTAERIANHLQTSEATGGIKLPCWFCASPQPIELLSVVRLCPGCLLQADAVRVGRTGGGET